MHHNIKNKRSVATMSVKLLPGIALVAAMESMSLVENW
jgi:hypothetical protein